MTLIDLFSTQMMESFGENFFFVLCHFVVRHFGHIPVGQMFEMELQAIPDDHVFGSPGPLSIDSDPSRKAIPYPCETITEDEPKPSSEEDGSDDNNNDKGEDINGSDNDTMENGDEHVQSTVEHMLSLLLEDAVSPGQNRELFSNFNIQHGENDSILETLSGEVGYEMELSKNEDE